MDVIYAEPVGWCPKLVQEELSDGTAVWFASHPVLDGLNAHGKTAQEADEAYQAVVRDYNRHIEDMFGHLPIPMNRFKAKCDLIGGCTVICQSP